MDLVADVQGLDLPKGIESSLTSKLDAAIAAMDRGQDKAAVNKLNAFMNQAEAQRGKRISDADTDALIAAAQEIIAAI